MQTDDAPPGPIRLTMSWLAWPGLLTICLLITGYGVHIGWPALFFNLAYAVLIVSLLVLERVMPHEPSWNENDGQTFANLAHTLLSKGVVQTVVVFSTVIGITTYVTCRGGARLWHLAARLAVVDTGPPRHRRRRIRTSSGRIASLMNGRRCGVSTPSTTASTGYGSSIPAGFISSTASKASCSASRSCSRSERRWKF